MSERRRPEIPAATDDLLAAGRRKVGEGRANLRALQPVGDDAETERAVQEITHSYGAHAQIPPADRERPPAIPHQPESAPKPLAPARTKYVSFRIDVPQYLDQELTMRAAKETPRVTKAYLIMEALHRAGYAVRAEDLIPDRRKTRWQTR